MNPAYDYEDLDAAIMQEMWRGNRTHAGITNALNYLEERYTKRYKGVAPPIFGEIVSRRIGYLKRLGMTRKAATRGKWIPVPDELIAKR